MGTPGTPVTTPRPGPAVRVHAATVGHGHVAVLRAVQLTISAGERALVLGPNGGGKSTLLQSLVGQADVLAGRIRVGGFDVHRDRVRALASVGYLGHQEPCYPGLDLRENLALHAATRGCADEVDPLLDRLGLLPHAHTRYAAASRGTKRRLGLAQALLGDPGLLLVDEPETGLDEAARQIFADALHQRLGPDHATVVATHDATAYADWAHVVAWAGSGQLQVERCRAAETFSTDELAAAIARLRTPTTALEVA